MRLWNPAAFFISLMMSMIMSIIFGIAVPNILALDGGLPWDMCLYLWPLRWLTAYLLINIIVYPIGFGLAEIVFHFNPDRDGMGLWNPAAFFISFMMSMIMPIIFGIYLPKFFGLPGLSWDLCLYMWPIRWLTAYLLINIVIYPIGFGLAKKVFGFDPMANNN